MADKAAITPSSPIARGREDRRLSTLLYRTLKAEGPLPGGGGSPLFRLLWRDGSLGEGADDRPVSSNVIVNVKHEADFRDRQVTRRKLELRMGYLALRGWLSVRSQALLLI